MLPSNHYEDYVAALLHQASKSVDESERQLYLAMAAALKNAALAKRDVLNDPEARNYKPRFLN